jgi:hypothetical protein
VSTVFKSVQNVLKMAVPFSLYARVMQLYLSHFTSIMQFLMASLKLNASMHTNNHSISHRNW